MLLCPVLFVLNTARKQFVNREEEEKEEEGINTERETHTERDHL